MNVKELEATLQCISDGAEIFIVTPTGRIPLKVDMVKSIWDAASKKTTMEIIVGQLNSNNLR